MKGSETGRPALRWWLGHLLNPGLAAACRQITMHTAGERENGGLERTQDCFRNRQGAVKPVQERKDSILLLSVAIRGRRHKCGNRD